LDEELNVYYPQFVGFYSPKIDLLRVFQEGVVSV